MTITLAGTNWFGVKSRLDELENNFVQGHGELAIEKLDGAETGLEQIQNALNSVPFLVSKKMVVVHDLSADKQASEAIEAILSAAQADTAELVIVEAKLDKRSVYYKQLKKHTEFQEFNELDEYQLADWLVDEAKTQKGELTKNDARYLIQRVGANQTALSHELEKLIQYNPKISKDSIGALTEESPSSTIFNLIDSAFSGDLKTAFRLYDEQRMQKVEPQAIHAMLVWQMHAVALVSQAPRDANSAKIASDSGMSPFVIHKSQRIAHEMGRTRILEFLTLLRDIDYKSKRIALDYDEAMRYAISNLASSS